MSSYIIQLLMPISYEKLNVCIFLYLPLVMQEILLNANYFLNHSKPVLFIAPLLCMIIQEFLQKTLLSAKIKNFYFFIEKYSIYQ